MKSRITKSLLFLLLPLVGGCVIAIGNRGVSLDDSFGGNKGETIAPTAKISAKSPHDGLVKLYAADSGHLVYCGPVKRHENVTFDGPRGVLRIGPSDVFDLAKGQAYRLVRTND